MLPDLSSLATSWGPTLVGLIFAVFVGNMVGSVTTRMQRQQARGMETVFSPSAVRDPEGAQLVGLIERTLYVAFKVHPAVVGVWLILKVVSYLKTRQERNLLNPFFVGTGLSLLYGVVGVRLTGWIETGRILEAIAVPLGLIAFTGYLAWRASKQQPLPPESATLQTLPGAYFPAAAERRTSPTAWPHDITS
jgi:hypothetical protein